MPQQEQTRRRALISLGGNIGDVGQTFAQAVKSLTSIAAGPVQVSRLYQTIPVGQAAGGTFLNAAVSIEVTCSGEELLGELQRVERTLGRVRETHWGPRTLDLDIIGFGQEIVQSPTLTIPHPACWYRRFVLDPLMDVAPDWKHPQLQKTVRELLNDLAQRPLRVGIAGQTGDRPDLIDQIQTALQSAFSSTALNVVTESEGFIPAPELPLTLAPTPVSVRTISLAQSSEPAILAIEVVKAALDVPLAVGDIPD